MVQYASCEESFLTLSSLNTKVKKFWMLGCRVLVPGLQVLGPRVLGSGVLMLDCARSNAFTCFFVIASSGVNAILIKCYKLF